MVEYRKLAPKEFPSVPESIRRESAYWKEFKAISLLRESAPISCINFLPVQPYDFFVASGARINIHSSLKNEVLGSITKLNQPPVFSDMRRDGRLLATVDASGELKIFGVKTHSALRDIQAHERAIKAVKFVQNQQVVTGSDDAKVKVWDITSKMQQNVFEGHTDNICALFTNPSNPNLIFSGSDDHTVKLWDARSNECTLTLNHGSPVRSLLAFQGSGLLVSAGGTELKIWDIFSGGRLSTTMDIHQKTITCLTFDASGERIISGSLDHQIKVVCTKDYKVIHSFRYSSPVGCIAFSPSGSSLIVGMTDGLLSIKHRMKKTLKKTPNNDDSEQKPLAAQSADIDSVDLVVEERKKIKLKPYDKALKSHKYGEALDSVMLNECHSAIVVGLLEELISRRALSFALKGRGEKSLKKIIRLLTKLFRKIEYVKTLIKTTNILLDDYESVLHKYPSLKEDLAKLRDCLSLGIYQSEFSIETMGCVKSIIYASRT